MFPNIHETGGVLILALVLLAAPAFGDSTGDPTDYRLRRYDNGATLIHDRKANPPVFAVKVFVPAGSAADPEGKEGLARLTARMLTSQTARRDMVSFSRFADDHGLRISASVYPDFTELSFTSTTEFHGELLTLLREVFTRPTFRKPALARLKKQQLSAISQRKDSAFQFGFDEALRSFYGDHPYAHPETGNASAVRDLTAEDCRSFFERFYHTESLVVSSVGDVPRNRMEELVRNLELPGGQPAKVPAQRADPPSEHQFRGSPVRQPTHVLVYPAPPIQSENYPATKLLDALLGGGMGSLLFSEIREKRSMGYQVGSLYPSRRSTSYFMIYLGGGTPEGDSFREALEEPLRRLAEEGPTPSEMEQAKEYLTGNFLLSHQTHGKQAWYRGFYEIMGRGASYDERYPEAIRQVERNQIRELARTLLVEHDPLFLTVRPGDSSP